MEDRQRKAGGPCPYVGNPLDECYVAGMNSQNIEQAIHYCGANYEECDIYKLNMTGMKSKVDNDTDTDSDPERKLGRKLGWL